MKTAFYFLLFAFCCFDSQAQIERDDVQQVVSEYNVFKGQVPIECGDAQVKVSTAFELHGEQGFMIDVTNVKEVRMMLFDKKGTKLFESEISVLYNNQTDLKDGKRCKTIDTGWNGRHQGQLLPEAVYVYTLNFVCTDDKKFKGNGFLELKHD